MSEVYSGAAKTIVWLGEGQSEEDDLAVLHLFQYLTSVALAKRDSEDADRYFCDLVSRLDWPEWHDLRTRALSQGIGNIVDMDALVVWASLSMIDEDERMPVFWENEVLCADVCEVRKLMHALFNRRYFSRRWVCQELYHSSEATLEARWGPCAFPLVLFPHEPITDILYLGLEVLEDSRNKPEVLGQNVDFFENLQLFMETSRCGQRLSSILQVKDEADEETETGRVLTGALNLLNTQQCSEPRDRLYALLSIDPMFDILPDYSLNVSQIYTDFARKLLERGWLDMILDTLKEQWAQAEEPVNADLASLAPLSNLPSWAPDLRRKFVDGWADYTAVKTTVDDRDILTCQVNSVGVLDYGPKKPTESLAVSRDGSARFSFQNQAHNRPKLAVGDLVCKAHGSSSHIVVLRPSSQAEGHYTIACVTGSGGDLWPSALETPIDVHIM